MKRKTRFEKRVSRQLLTGQPLSFRLEDDDPEVVLAETCGHPANVEVYRPRETSLIPKLGAWVMVIRPLPPMERDLHKEITVGRVFYAEQQDNADDEGFRPTGDYLVTLRTPFGELKLWPYEYTRLDVEELMAMYQKGEFVFHPAEHSTHALNDVLFYARSRGIGLADAMVIALGSLRGPVGWFEPAEALREEVAWFAEASTRIGVLTEVNHQRRAAARARKAAG